MENNNQNKPSRSDEIQSLNYLGITRVAFLKETGVTEKYQTDDEFYSLIVQILLVLNNFKDETNSPIHGHKFIMSDYRDKDSRVFMSLIVDRQQRIIEVQKLIIFTDENVPDEVLDEISEKNNDGASYKSYSTPVILSNKQ